MRTYRMLKGESIVEIAKRARINPAQWGHYENDRRTPTIEILRKICHAMSEISPSILLQLEATTETTEKETT